MMSEGRTDRKRRNTGTFSTVKVSPKEENMDPLAYQFSQYVSDGVGGLYSVYGSGPASGTGGEFIECINGHCSRRQRRCEGRACKIK